MTEHAMDMKHWFRFLLAIIALSASFLYGRHLGRSSGSKVKFSIHDRDAAFSAEARTCDGLPSLKRGDDGSYSVACSSWDTPHQPSYVLDWSGTDECINAGTTPWCPLPNSEYFYVQNHRTTRTSEYGDSIVVGSTDVYWPPEWPRDPGWTCFDKADGRGKHSPLQHLACAKPDTGEWMIALKGGVMSFTLDPSSGVSFCDMEGKFCSEMFRELAGTLKGTAKPKAKATPYRGMQFEGGAKDSPLCSASFPIEANATCYRQFTDGCNTYTQAQDGDPLVVQTLRHCEPSAIRAVIPQAHYLAPLTIEGPSFPMCALGTTCTITAVPSPAPQEKP